jgi:two-component system chemotaxis response regulator CheY
MIVDDMEVVRRAMAALLKHDGHRTVCASSGAEALSRIHQGAHPGLVLMDIEMPDMDGLTALQRLRREPGTSHTPVVMMTSRTDMETESEAIRRGADGYLKKSLLSWDEVHNRLAPYLAAQHSS